MPESDPLATAAKEIATLQKMLLDVQARLPRAIAAVEAAKVQIHRARGQRDAAPAKTVTKATTKGRASGRS